MVCVSECCRCTLSSSDARGAPAATCHAHQRSVSRCHATPSPVSRSRPAARQRPISLPALISSLHIPILAQQVDVSKVDAKKFDDAYFKKPTKDRSKKSEEDFFQGEAPKKVGHCQLYASCVPAVYQVCASCVHVCQLCANCVPTVCQLFASCVPAVCQLCACVPAVCNLTPG